MGTTLEVFFTGKFFRIPTYQRDYAWDTGNVDDLIDDIIEAIETNTSHYIGTFILSETSNPKIYVFDKLKVDQKGKKRPLKS
jgi:uncharacterized protein with ParB-like and HNH nuclease domain